MKEKRYEEFLSAKARLSKPTGFDVDESDIHERLFPFQRAIVRWALKRGRAAIFADCGMGKTLMQLEWARHVSAHAGGPVLILAPLAVSEQTRREGESIGVPVTVCRKQSDVLPGVNIANYEMLDHFDPAAFVAVVLDESSILKSFYGKTRTQIIDAFDGHSFKLACTATPAPNDHSELGNHAEFLGIMTRVEMFSMFFVHDSAQGVDRGWRIKGHSQDAFWQWVASWSCYISRPSDLGFADDGYEGFAFELPPRTFHQHVVEAAPMDGFLFPIAAKSIPERMAARRTSVDERAAKCAEIINGSPARPWIVWCNLNTEAEAICRLVPGAVNVTGSDSPSAKTEALLGFAAGEIEVLVTKPSIAGFGMNWQNCAHVAFVGLSDSYEQYYQAVRRCWRFGQSRPVEVHIVTAETEGAVVANIQRKEQAAITMAREMVQHMAASMRHEITGASMTKNDYEVETAEGDGWKIHLGDSVEGVASLAEGSVDYSIFSPPFASLFTYSAHDRDMGNCESHAQFFEHFDYLIAEMFRATAPGRLLSFHCMQLPTSKLRDGVIGLTDFRGKLLAAFERRGWIFHSEVCIWKDPVTSMQRTKALGLLYKQVRKDSAMSRQGIPDYLVTMRKPGENAKPITHTQDTYPLSRWQKVASPVWMDIDQSETLNYREARQEEDERHICPLQLEVIRRGIALWSNPGDLVLSPFAGIGSEGFVALGMGRRFVGFELKRTYFDVAVKNLKSAHVQVEGDLFADEPDAVAANA